MEIQYLPSSSASLLLELNSLLRKGLRRSDMCKYVCIKSVLCAKSENDAAYLIARQVPIIFFFPLRERQPLDFGLNLAW